MKAKILISIIAIVAVAYGVFAYISKQNSTVENGGGETKEFDFSIDTGIR